MAYRRRRTSSAKGDLISRDLVYGVGELTREMRFLLETHFDRISVRGEITGLSRPQSGHLYFSLVDDAPKASGASRTSSSQLPVVIWRSAAARLRVDIDNGARVVVSGLIGLYEPRGTYQLIADRLVPEGVGDLQAAFERLRAKLAEEGLFDAEHKRPLPYLPSVIGLVTSPTGAAVRDFLCMLQERYPTANVRLAPARVQGEGAAAEIAAAIGFLAREGVDVIVVTRGGGSLEDLWAFNEEPVVRAIFASEVPVVSAIGHEVDVTLSDLVADLRAPTPTAAAECVVPSRADIVDSLESSRRRLALALRAVADRGTARIQRFAALPLFRDPQAVLQKRFESVDRLARDLRDAIHARGRDYCDALVRGATRLDSLSPLAVLRRGFAVASDSDGHVIRSVDQVSPGSSVSVRVSRGSFTATVDGTMEGEL